MLNYFELTNENAEKGLQNPCNSLNNVSWRNVKRAKVETNHCEKPMKRKVFGNAPKQVEGVQCQSNSNYLLDKLLDVETMFSLSVKKQKIKPFKNDWFISKLTNPKNDGGLL